MEGFLDIRLPPMAAAAGDPRHRHHPGGRRDDLLWRGRDTGKLLILTQVILSAAAALRCGAAGAVHGQPHQDGPDGHTGLAGGLRGPDRRLADRPQHQANLGCNSRRLTPDRSPARPQSVTGRHVETCTRPGLPRHEPEAIRLMRRRISARKKNGHSRAAPDPARGL